MNKPKETKNKLEWAIMWDGCNHQGKLDICEMHHITYDTGKHWRSEFNIPHLPIASTPTVDKPVDTIEEFLRLRPSISLDFASFDIETSNLKADFSIVLSAVIKPFGRPPVVFRADNYPNWEKNRNHDKAIVIDIANELIKHAIIVTHYGTGFDIPYLKAKMTYHGLQPLPPRFMVDSYQIAKRNFATSRRRLETLGEYFGLGKKSAVEGVLWVDAAYGGDRKSMDAIVEHNIVDCEILEKLAALTFEYLKSIPKM